jgi:hypothetical protein
MMIAASLPPHFWVEAICTSTYLINIQPSSTLQGGIPLEHLFACSPDYTTLRLFGYVCYILQAPRERIKLAAQSIECVFLGYSDEHKAYRCWDPVSRQMCISRDVTFGESRPFYPRPSSLAFSVEDISFLLFPDTPSFVHVDLPSRPILIDAPPSPPFSPPRSSPSSFDPPPTSPMSPFPFHYSRRSHVLDATSDVSSPHDVPSSYDEMTPPLLTRLLHPPNRYSPSHYGLYVALEPTSYYRDVAHHPEWQLAMAKEIVALECTSTCDLVSLPPGVRPITCKWVYKIKTRSDGSLERNKAWLVARGF